jgi:RecG-like helicase
MAKILVRAVNSSGRMARLLEGPDVGAGEAVVDLVFFDILKKKRQNPFNL